MQNTNGRNISPSIVQVLPQSDSKKYLASKRGYCPIKFQYQTFSVVWVVRFQNFHLLAPGLLERDHSHESYLANKPLLVAGIPEDNTRSLRIVQRMNRSLRGQL